MDSITSYIEKDLGLIINQTKSKVCGATLRLPFLGFNIQNLMGKWDADLVSRQNNDLKVKSERLTRRKSAGEFEEIVKEINQVTVGWINYYGISRMKRIYYRYSTMAKSQT